MSLELAKKALEDAQAAVDKEIALENAIKMEVRIKTKEEVLQDNYSEESEDGDIVLYDCDAHLHRHEND